MIATPRTAPLGGLIRAVIGLGSNVGDRIGMLRSAVLRLPNVLARSPVYETAPVGPPQPDYLNAAVLVDMTQTPLELFESMLTIEQALGRIRRERWGPRTIDLDLLFIEGQTVSDPRLVVPHPHLHERAFALLPLLDLLPDARDPRTDQLVSGLTIDRAGVRKTELSLV